MHGLGQPGWKYFGHVHIRKVRYADFIPSKGCTDPISNVTSRTPGLEKSQIPGRRPQQAEQYSLKTTPNFLMQSKVTRTRKETTFCTMLFSHCIEYVHVRKCSLSFDVSSSTSCGSSSGVWPDGSRCACGSDCWNGPHNCSVRLLLTKGSKAACLLVTTIAVDFQKSNGLFESLEESDQ
jgi:hypothetical protein